MLVAQSCSTLCDPMDCSPPGSSIHGILQARILEWIAISFSWGSSQPRDLTQVSRVAGIFLALWATRGVSGLQQSPGLLQPSQKTCHPGGLRACVLRKKVTFLIPFLFLHSFFPFYSLVLIYRVKTLLNFCAILYLSSLLLSEQIIMNLKDTYLSSLCV